MSGTRRDRKPDASVRAGVVLVGRLRVAIEVEAVPIVGVRQRHPQRGPHVQRRPEERDVDPLTTAAIDDQGGDDSLRRIDRARRPSVVGTEPHRFLARPTQRKRYLCRQLRGELATRAVRPRSLGPPSRDHAGHEAAVVADERVDVDGRRRRQLFVNNEYVGQVDEGRPFRGLRVEHSPPLVPIERGKDHAETPTLRHPSPGSITPGRLDLDDVGSGIGQQSGRERTGNTFRVLDDSHAGQWPGGHRCAFRHAFSSSLRAQVSTPGMGGPETCAGVPENRQGGPPVHTWPHGSASTSVR